MMASSSSGIPSEPNEELRERLIEVADIQIDGLVVEIGGFPNRPMRQRRRPQPRVANPSAAVAPLPERLFTAQVSFLRSSSLRTLPIEVFGSSGSKATTVGTLKRERRSEQ